MDCYAPVETIAEDPKDRLFGLLQLSLPGHSK